MESPHFPPRQKQELLWRSNQENRTMLSFCLIILVSNTGHKKSHSTDLFLRPALVRILNFILFHIFKAYGIGAGDPK